MSRVRVSGVINGTTTPENRSCPCPSDSTAVLHSILSTTVTVVTPVQHRDVVDAPNVSVADGSIGGIIQDDALVARTVVVLVGAVAADAPCLDDDALVGFRVIAPPGQCVRWRNGVPLPEIAATAADEGILEDRRGSGIGHRRRQLAIEP